MIKKLAPFSFFLAQSLSQLAYAADPPALLKLPAPIESKVIAGNQSTDPTDTAQDPNGGIVASDQMGNLALALLLDSVNWYQDQGLYNDSHWKVERSVLSESGLELFTIYEAKKKASEFVSSKNGLFYKFSSKADHVVYELQGNTFSKAAEIKASQITPGTFTRLGTLVANDIQGSRSFVIAPASTRVSLFADLGNNVEGSILGTTPLGALVELHYPVPSKPFDTWRDYQGPPDSYENKYGWNRQMFSVTDGKSAGVVWQSKDPLDKGQVYATWLSQDPYQAKTVKLPSESGKVLAAATSDGAGALYYLLVQSGDGKPNGTRAATLLKASSDGKEQARSTPDTSASGLNITFFGELDNGHNIASLAFSNGALALIIGRQMHKSKDGLNHQGAIAALFDAKTLSLQANLGQTSGHSFSNVLTVAKDGGFVGVDLGDNYPRGINLHRIQQEGLVSRVVYTFKTEHQKECNFQGAPCRYEVYPEISSDEATYYKWSNDNATYTELGGIVETPYGWVVVFASEHPNLDGTRVGANVNDPRDLGLVIVRKDFERSPAPKDPNVVSESLVISSGETAKGGFYDFGGRWNPQRSTGVNWLTSYKADASQHASRIKTTLLESGEILILWEEWTKTSYKQTWGMTLRVEPPAANQKVSFTVTQPAFSLGNTFRLNPRDDLLVQKDQVIAVGGDGNNRQLVVTSIKLTTSK